MLLARIALGLLVVAGGLALFWVGSDSDWLTWVGVGVVLLGLMLSFWLGAEAWPLAAVALAAALASVGLASFTESGPSKKPASQARTQATTAPTTTARTQTKPSTTTTGRTQTGPTAPVHTGTTPSPKLKLPELPRTL